MSKLSIVTTSWDDGDPADIKVAEFLHARKMRGTFYVPLSFEGRQNLDPERLRSLTSGGFEIGAHGVSHLTLTKLNPSEIAKEVGVCKYRLEQAVGRKIRMFCYPRGRFNGEVVREVRKAGYEGARTTRMFRQDLDFDAFQMPTSLQAYPNTRVQYARNLVRGRNIQGLCEYVFQTIWCHNWVAMAKILFDRILKEGGVWHLYGHSWQIAEMNLWDDLKEILDYVSGREDVRYLTNGAI
jgi:peptidoglycan/xylan/chitin deacetylase (PgdA/CDA1 family)